MPIWEEDGFTIVQSSAILRVLGIRYGYYSEDPMTCWACDSIVDYLEDKTTQYVSYYDKMADPAAKDAWMSGYWDVVLPVLEARLAHGKQFIAGTARPTICDFKAFSTHIAWDSKHNSGCAVDAAVQQELLSKIAGYPKLAAWRARMSQECAAYLPTRPPTPY